MTEIFNLLVLGTSRADILQYCSKKREESKIQTPQNVQWDVGERQIDEYIRHARKRLKQSASYQRDEMLGIAIERLNRLYKDNLKVQDYKGALAVQREINTLLGLHAPQQVQHTGANGGKVVIKVVRE